jgi:hypothetical protein
VAIFENKNNDKGARASRTAAIGEEDFETQEVYFALLDDKLSALIRPDSTFESVLNRARGAFPTVVLNRLRSIGLDRKLSPSNPTAKEGGVITSPELHPLNFEWYFARNCSDRIAEVLISHSGDVLCMGAPTVAAAVARRGRAAVLLDNNHLVVRRLSRDLRSVKFLRCDLCDELPITTKFPMVFFDSPWYPEPASWWLWQASQVCSPGGLIGFALFPSLLRPRASQERRRILEQASVLGEVSIQEESLLYETPLFEREALAKCGIELCENWRRADLVFIRMDQSATLFHPPAARASREEWDSYVVGTQVIKLRRSNQHKDGRIISAVDGCSDYVFSSVSMRDPRRSEIDLWTSRNRVARVGRRDLLVDILDQLAQGASLEDIKGLSKISSLGPQDRQELLVSLRTILDRT